LQNHPRDLPKNRDTVRFSAHSDAEQTLKDVGLRIRALRLKQKITQQELSDIVGVSPGMLSLVERGLVSPSLTSLAAVAHGLGISLTDLIAGGSATEHEVVTRGAEQPVYETPDRVLRWVLKEDKEHKVDITINEYGPDVGNSPTGVQHSGYEYGYILEGQLTVEIDGVAHVLGKGDLVSLQSTRRHKIWNYGRQPARAIWFNLMHRY